MLHRRALLLAAAVGSLALGCSLDQALPAPGCVDGETAIIAAQSVPTAQLVPCLDRLPNGWTVRAVTIDQDGSEVRLDSDRAGFDAARLHFRQSCDTGDAVPVPDDQEGAETFEYVERVVAGFRADRIYVFEGGCVLWEFDFDEGASATLSVELQNRLTLVTRQFLNDAVRESFIDEEF